MESLETLLNKNKITYKIQGNDYIVTCLNPEHEDSSPSMRIDKDTGMFNCFACKFKGNIYTYFGLNANTSSIRVAKLKKKINDLKVSIDGLDMPKGAVPYNKTFRHISVKTLRHFEVFTTSEVDELLDRIIVPIKDTRGKYIVFIARHILSNANPKYVIYPSKVKVPTYPVIMPKYTKSIVLVEGIFDMLNMYDKGMTNVVCTFGTQTLKAETEKKMLYYKAQGISKVFILFDGDDAGNTAAKELEPLLVAAGFEVEIIGLAEGSDPGDLTKEEVDSIITYIAD
jgi:DNA primase